MTLTAKEEDFPDYEAMIKATDKELSEIVGEVDGWFHIDYRQPPKPYIEGRTKRIFRVLVWDEKLNEVFNAQWRDDGWIYDTLMTPSPNNVWWYPMPYPDQLEWMSIKENCQYHKK